MIFETRVAGIPCQCHVFSYDLPRPETVTGPGMGDALPPEPAEITFALLDRKGYPAPWLERKLDTEEVDRLAREYLQYINHAK
jgi:hypothetical protein